MDSETLVHMLKVGLGDAKCFECWAKSVEYVAHGVAADTTPKYYFSCNKCLIKFDFKAIKATGITPTDFIAIDFLSGQ